MSDASTPAEHAASDVSPTNPTWATFRAACRKHGATTVVDCAALTGIPRRTLYDLRDRPESVQLRTALRIRAATNLSLDELYPTGEAA